MTVNTFRATLLALLMATGSGAQAEDSGFLEPNELTAMQIERLLPPQPVAGDATDNRDLALFWQSRTGDITPRRMQAAQDDEYSPEKVWPRFAPAVGLSDTLAPAKVQNLLALIGRAQLDGAALVKPIKREVKHGGRLRPFVRFPTTPTCLEPVDLVPGHKAVDYQYKLPESGSYPSTHALLGQLWGMTLAELVPERAAEALARGIDFGESRAVCGFHYESDLIAGRTAAAALYARLHADPEFVAAMQAAKRELDGLRQQAQH